SRTRTRSRAAGSCARRRLRADTARWCSSVAKAPSRNDMPLPPPCRRHACTGVARCPPSDLIPALAGCGLDDLPAKRPTCEIGLTRQRRGIAASWLGSYRLRGELRGDAAQDANRARGTELEGFAGGFLVCSDPVDEV